ncbi:XRE family transcriptional regulator [Deinococcus sp.]|uniref:XRE family transcriptional regulator n=1 Tax=Deinococcus sp. TaxID=47478 RepID=UPI0025C41CE5|nr:XRE family transcriptional regulator [Deinococcus sp.]
MDTNLRVREAMKAAARRRGLTHAQLASRLGIKQPSVTQLLNGTYGKIPQSLLEALDVLGLEITVIESPNADDPETAQAKAEAMSLLSANPWGKKPMGLDTPVKVKGPAIEELLHDHRGPDL